MKLQRFFLDIDPTTMRINGAGCRFIFVKMFQEKEISENEIKKSEQTEEESEIVGADEFH